MKLKRSLAIVLALLMVLPLAACSKAAETDKDQGTAATTTKPTTVTTTTVEAPDDTNPTGDGSTDETDPVVTDPSSGEVVTTTTVTDSNGDPVTQATEPGETTAKPTTTRTKKATKPGQTQSGNSQGNTIGKLVEIKEGTTPVEKGLNFGGKEYRFAYYGSSWDQDHTDWHNDFQKQYNVKLKIDAVPTTEYVASLSAALAAKKPYDIVFFYNFDYPEQITANVMQPLDDYITTADMWGKTSATTGGFSTSLDQAMSMDGHIYCVAGNYLQTPTVVWYNKKEFAKAGYTGAKDPMAMYNAGTWSWQKLYDMLYAMQKPDKGIYGINSIAPYYDHQFINSFNTDFAKLTADGRLVENLSDPNLYAAYEMLQKFCYGEHKVANPKDIFESGRDQFFNGTTLSMISTAGLYWTAVTEVPKASAFDKSMSNLGMVPLPTYGKNGPHSIWDWMGYGAGAGASKEGVLCALAFAKHDSIHNQKQAYHPDMPADMKKLSCGILDSDNLIGPKNGFSSSAGSLGGVSTTISQAIAINGQNITVVLKGYKKVAQTIIDTALKG